MSISPTSALPLNASSSGQSFSRSPPKPDAEDVAPNGETSTERGEGRIEHGEGAEGAWEEISHYSGSPWAPSPAHRAEHISQLPTPQSPSNLGIYVDSLNYNMNSPVRSNSRNSRTSTSALKHRSPLFASDRSEISGSLMTPESSPLFARRPKSLAMSVTSLPSTPPRNSQSKYTLESFTTPVPRAIVCSTPSPHSPNTPTHSGLSSPFVDKSERHTPNRISSRRSPDNPFASPAPAGDIFAASQSSPPLPAPIPQRAAGGEMTRLRLQLAAEQAAQMQETESRRPDYLRRTKRPSSELDDGDVEMGDQENNVPMLGVIESPVKGRRLALFQETSEESFEQSLLAGGYPIYGIAPGYAEPTTPQSNGTSGLSQRAVEWIQQATPGQLLSPQIAVKDDIDPPQNEHEARKRRRLDAFKDHNISFSHKKLYAVEVEGHGRVLLDQPLEEISLQTETPTKRRNTRRKRGGVQDSPSRKKAPLAETHDEPEAGRPNWLDQVFPWSMRVHEREELAHKEEEQKLKWIERYLERESDEDEDQDQSLGLPPADIDDPPPKRGRGKMVPLPVNPDEARANVPKRTNKYHPSDPADARAALLSKRSVRAFAFRRQQEEQEVVCVCRGKDDGRELVQCDDCKEWFHLECIGIKDIRELGQEEDPWYCSDCLGIPAARSSSPTFVPTDDLPSARGRRDPLFFQAASQESPPGIAWNTLRIPTTPVRGRGLTHPLSSRSSWGDSSSQAGPQTPSSGHRSSRAYHTPGLHMPLDEAVFDPSLTPSRGMHFSGPFTTPKPLSFWPARSSAVQTPSRPAKKQPAPWAFDFHEEASPYPLYDDSPIRRSQPKDKSHFARHIQDSPLATRSTSTQPLGRPRSPLSAKSTLDRSTSRSALV